MHFPDEHADSLSRQIRHAASEQLFEARLSAYQREAADDAELFRRLAANLDSMVTAGPAFERATVDRGEVADMASGDGHKVVMLGKIDQTDDAEPANPSGPTEWFGRSDHAEMATAEGGKNVHPPHTGFAQEIKGDRACAESCCAVPAVSTTSSSCLPSSLVTSSGLSERGEKTVVAGRSARRKPSAKVPKGQSWKGSRGVKTVITAGVSSAILKPWKRLTRSERFAEVVRNAAADGGFAVTLNLSIGREHGTSESEDPMRNISKRMNEALNRHDLAGLPLALLLEAAPGDGRLHLHGVVILRDHDKSRVMKALREGAGFIHGNTGSRQADLKPIYDAEGWSNYLSKAVRRTGRNVGHDRLIWISQSLTRPARDRYEEIRRGRPPANRNSDLSGMITVSFIACA